MIGTITKLFKSGKASIEPLSISLIPSGRGDESDSVTQALKLFVRPLAYSCDDIFVYGLKKDNPLLQQHKDILTPDKGRFRIDKTKEIIQGHESLWTSTNWKRGSIVMISHDQKIDWKKLLALSYRPGEMTTPNMGNSQGAIRLCKNSIIQGHVAICFLASNGIEEVLVFAPGKELRQLFRLAYKYCQEINWE